VLLLALDTSTPAVTVALHDGSAVLAQRTEVGVNRHGELLAPSIEYVLRTAGVTPADLTHVVAGTGPGPFTGLRVGLVTARALGDALGIPVHGVPSLDAVALQHRDSSGQGGLVVMTDARRREVYWSGYTPDGRRTHGPGVDRPDDLEPQLPRQAALAGAGALIYRDRFPDHVVRDDRPYPEAASLAAIAAAAVAEGTIGPADPLYLRRPDAVPPAGYKPVVPA
jgi:tRNA threonylcarbamoyl adenosine modification protein YeaZ